MRNRCFGWDVLNLVLTSEVMDQRSQLKNNSLSALNAERHKLLRRERPARRAARKSTVPKPRAPTSPQIPATTFNVFEAVSLMLAAPGTSSNARDVPNTHASHRRNSSFCFGSSFGILPSVQMLKSATTSRTGMLTRDDTIRAARIRSRQFRFVKAHHLAVLFGRQDCPRKRRPWAARPRPSPSAPPRLTRGTAIRNSPRNR